MIYTIYAGGKLLYDSTLPDDAGWCLHAAKIEETLNKGGKTTLVVPRTNPLYNSFSPLNTLVEVYRNNALRWRGRALVPGRDVYGRKSIVCEGEMCFLQDSTQKPGPLSGSPTAVFSSIIQRHNSRVEGWKRFGVGTVSVQAENDNIALDVSANEKTYDVAQHLIRNYGGYILFDSLPDGSRRINWFADLPFYCNQPIRYGFNLLDFSSSGTMSGYATRIVPYGAEDENGNRLQINIDGRDYVENADVVAQRGIVEASVIYEGVTDPEELARLATQDVSYISVIPETLRLSAQDMAQQDLAFDSFSIGQRVTAESELHDLSGEYDLISIVEDLLDPGTGGITLTRSAAYMENGASTLTGSISKQQQADKRQFAAYLTMVGTITQRILGAKGGAVRLLDLDDDGFPDTLYIADKPDPQKAVKVWRINYEGWAGSKTGFDGPFIMGATLEDGLLAAAVTAAHLVAGTITSADRKTFVCDLDKGILNMNATSLSIKGKTVDQIASDEAEAAADAALSDAKTYADKSSTAAVKAQTQQDIMNILTKNGAYKGIWLADGSLYINGDIIQAGQINAKNVSMKGKFSVYNGSDLGGYLGYLEGISDGEATDGIGIMNAAGDCFSAATDAGAIMSAKGTHIYVIGGRAVCNGDLYVKGNVYTNQSID